MSLPAVIYTRVSTGKQAEEGVSLEAQLARARAYAETHGMKIIGEFSDAGISGKSTKNRPEFRAALDLVCRQKAALVFYSLSRVSRSTRDLLAIADRVRTAGANMVSLQEQIDTTTAMGTFVFTLLSALCALERELVGERTRTALRHLRAEGKAIGPTPYGFDRQGEYLVENPAEQNVLARMAQSRGAGRSYHAIAVELNAKCIPTKQGHRWTRGRVRTVLLARERWAREAVS
mgnify:CR=1 FL=1